MAENEDINPLMEKYEEETGKNAKWGGELTEGFKDWREEQEDLKAPEKEYIELEVPGFNELMERGVPAGSNVIISGGPGTGKTIFCLQSLYEATKKGHDTVYLTLEELPKKLVSHLWDFGFEAEITKKEKERIFLEIGDGRMAIRRLEPIGLARSVEAMLEKAAGRLPVDVSAVLDIIPEDYEPYMIAMDSISAMETAFSGEIRKYRVYIEQLFRYYEDLGATSLLITESHEAPKKVSKTGVEEFLTDGIIIFYYSPGEVSVRRREIEITKMRGAAHSSRKVPLRITEEGMKIIPGAVESETERSEEELEKAFEELLK